MARVKNTLKRIVLDTDTSAGRNFDLFIQFCIVLSLVSFAVETVEGLSENVQLILDWIEVGTVATFSVEYLLRIWLTDKKLTYIFTILK